MANSPCFVHADVFGKDAAPIGAGAHLRLQMQAEPGHKLQQLLLVQAQQPLADGAFRMKFQVAHLISPLR